jgi:hypothetical protein
MVGTDMAKAMIVRTKTIPIHQGMFQTTIRTGDILICRKTSLFGAIIGQFTKSEYVHAAMAGWVYGRSPTPHGGLPMLGETRGHREARLINLVREITLWPGLYDVYRVRSDYWKHVQVVPELAFAFMCLASGSGYSWKYCWWVWLHRRLPRFLHWLIPSIANSDSPATARNCSGLVHAALRYGGGPQLKPEDWAVVPGDYADPEHFTYIGTLFDTPEQVEAYTQLQENLS